MSKSATAGRTEKGQFGPGNPGRPRGARHKTTLAIEALLDGDAEAITKKAIALAKKGDSTALRLCIERIIPARRGRPMSLPDMPKLTSVGDVPGVVAFIMQSVAEGDITADEAGDLTAIVDRYVKAVEATEHEARLKALEERLAR
ncbi:DUF5681 domain-containing protein [Devosia sp. SD17-2]|uniref:DUF5681 domain-containing protein n=1 Tax=Devosia sp. SD17-2 TaxID=2976459 RepID=UPI0023D8A9CC|nr:DUF5681 domain-containing protein [Devosia sp. SD17-2]WEJ31994.1 hypothetical protein NYQ88_13905 [Devosia sp. SD17-2]